MIIFDCNGVLVDSEPIATSVVADAFQAVGLQVTPEIVARYFTGRRPADMFADEDDSFSSHTEYLVVPDVAFA